MRRSREDTVETRRKIVESASRLFRARGIAATSVADIMGSLGLTVGGFYRHFDSKEALVVEAIDAASLEAAQGHQTGYAPARGTERLSAMLDFYLSNAHRKNAAHGCPVAALCSEVGHETKATKEAFTAALQRLLAMVDTVVPRGAKERRGSLLHAASTAVGALVLARATSNEELADELLTAARKSLLDEQSRQL